VAITKIIHQTTNDKTKLDDLVAANIVRLKELNEGWDYRLYDEHERRDFISACYGERMLSCYDRIIPVYGAARADLFRYLLLYEYGGAYIDIKSTIDRPLDEVLRPDDQYILSYWRNGRGQPYEGWGVHANVEGVTNEFQQWHVVSAPKHPFLNAVIEKVVNNIETYDPIADGVGKKGVMKLTGPVAYTSAILPIKEAHAHRFVEIEDLSFRYTIFPADRKRQFGHEHIASFSNHYSTQVVPIIAADERGLRGAAVGAVTQSRLLARRCRNLLKRAVGRL
jgi:inositol phosphorylceramide mannosyltransferase catalytic subunit